MPWFGGKISKMSRGKPETGNIEIFNKIFSENKVGYFFSRSKSTVISFSYLLGLKLKINFIDCYQ